MNSDGDLVERHLRVLRVQVDALGVDAGEALLAVPAEVRDAVRARWSEETSLPVRRAHVLSGTGGPRAWFGGVDPSQGYYWRRQRTYLIDRLGWAQHDVEALDDATDKVLSHLEDPRPSGPHSFSVRGLVMGYVQSGKTANFCALTAKAADAGYKLVIVLSGIHNSLRQQTQRRINRTLGIDPTGVPLPEPGRRWIALTTDALGGDFRPGTFDANVLQGNEQVLLVVKKNATVLRRLTHWMGAHAPARVPVLVIDDEADQGSINTGGNRPPLDEEVDLGDGDVDVPGAEDEVDPSVINGLVRQLIAAFGRVAYVAYTATPFANVLINHLAVDREVFEDLYPRDFILALPCPNGYTGAERLFGRGSLPGESADLPGLDVIRFVPVHEANPLTPGARQLPGYVPVLPGSLKTALLDFIISMAGRHQRTGREGPSTMLIHTHHRKHVQNLLGPVIRDYLSTLRQAWRYDRESLRPSLYRRWQEDFQPVTRAVHPGTSCSFAKLEPFLDRAFRDPVPVIVLNSDSEDPLDYDADPALRAVVIGGNRLSRGLTLEGLLVSYYVRRAEYFDALMQMGRWFGYRERYVDLTRIWTTEELAGWFRDLALAEEELRRQVARYEAEGLTPTLFGPRIRSHPAMMITARNKMGSARTVQQNYSGHLLQTVAFRLDDPSWLRGNLDACASLVRELGQPNHHPEVGPDLPTWKGVPWQLVDGFLADYRFDPRGTHEPTAIRQYLHAQVSQGELTEWCVSLRCRTGPEPRLGDEPTLRVGGRAAPRIGRSRLRNSPHSIGTLVNPATLAGAPGAGDEEVGLSATQLQRARAAADGVRLGEELRRQRSTREAVLLLYPISPFSRPRRGEGNRIPLFDQASEGAVTVVGIALVFPESASAATIEYVAGSVGAPADG